MSVNRVEVEGQIIHIIHGSHTSSAHIYIAHTHPNEENLYPWQKSQSYFRLTFRHPLAKKVLKEIDTGKTIHAKGFLVGQPEDLNDPTGKAAIWINVHEYEVATPKDTA